MIENDGLLLPFIKLVFKKLDIPLSRLRVYHMFGNTIEFNIRQYIKEERYINPLNKYMRELRQIFRLIKNKSSINKQFKFRIESDIDNIKVFIAIYPDENENIEDLVTLLRLEGIL